MLVIWNERASPLRARAGADSRVMSSPAKRTSPRSGRTSPASWPISVVFPAPFGPMIACVSPRRTSRSMPSLARSAPKRFTKLRISRMLIMLAQHQAGEPAPEKEHREHEQGTQDDLPVHRPAREQVLEDEQRKGAQHRADHAP